MNAPTNRGDFLIREELGSDAVLAPVSNGVRWPVRPGAVYEILNSTSFESIPIIRAVKEGYDLIITLAGGEQVVMKNYFVNYNSDDEVSSARFEQSLPLQLSALDYSQPSELPTPQFDYGPQSSVGPVTLPPQSHNTQQGYYSYPVQIPPYEYEAGDGWGRGLLNIAGIGLGGLALATVGLRETDGISQIVNNANGDGSSSSSETGGSSALDLVVKELIERSKSLTLPADKDLYDSIQQDIKDLLRPSLGSTDAGDGIVINNNNNFGSTNSGAPQPDPAAASITAVTITRDDDYFTEGETVTVTVRFSDRVTSSDPGKLTFGFNDGTYTAQYAQGNGTNTLTFELVVPTINMVTELSAVKAALELGGSALIDSNDINVDLTELPAWQGRTYVEPLPKIIEITAIPDDGEFTQDLSAGKQVTFFVKYDNPISYDDDKLTLALNSGGSAEFVDQTGPDGEASDVYLKFVYTLQDGEEASDPARELLPVALAENDGANVQTLNGSNARVQITENVRTAFKEIHEIIYDLSQPSIAGFDLINITTTGDTIERDFGSVEGAKTLLKVSGAVRINYDEPVATEPAVGVLPELAIPELLTDAINELGIFDPMTGRAIYSETLTRPAEDSPTLNSAQIYEFSDVYIVLDDPDALPDADSNPNEVLLSVAEGLIVNMANILGQGGVPASSKLPADPAASIIGNALPTNNGGWDITLGAGPFIADSVRFDVDDYAIEAHGTSSDESQNIDQYQIVYARDANGFEGNYFDEFTGDLTDLSMNGSGVMRALVSGDSAVREVFVTPISELMVQIVETVDTPTSRDINDAKTSIGSFFNVDHFIHTEASFINATDVDGASVHPVDLNLAVALASLSAMDFVSGSLWNTLEVLTPIFLADASTEELVAAQQLIDSSRQITGNSASAEFDLYTDEISDLLAGMSDHVGERITFAPDDLTLVHDEIEYVLEDIDLNSLVEQQAAQPFEVLDEQLAVDLDEAFVTSGGGAIEYREWEIE